MPESERSPWQGRVDIEDGAAGRRWHQQVEPLAEGPPGVALLGLASDEGVRRNKGRPGAAQGPEALRRALAGMAWHHPLAAYDAGDISASAEDLEDAQAAYADTLARLLQAGHFALGLGGGHEIGWASYLGCRQYLDGQGGGVLGILNFDAHFDLRRPAPLTSSGTPFYQVAQDCRERGLPFRYACLGVARTANTQALFQRAEALGVHHLSDIAFDTGAVQELLQEFLPGIDSLYVTLCLDVMPAGMAPGVSAPAPLGVAPRQIIQALRLIAPLCRRYGVRWLAADIAELSPRHDIEGRTAALAARLADEIVAVRTGAGADSPQGSTAS